jgi:hypothetical protein
VVQAGSERCGTQLAPPPCLTPSPCVPMRVVSGGYEREEDAASAYDVLCIKTKGEEVGGREGGREGGRGSGRLHARRMQATVLMLHASTPCAAWVKDTPASTACMLWQSRPQVHSFSTVYKSCY